MQLDSAEDLIATGEAGEIICDPDPYRLCRILRDHVREEFGELPCALLRRSTDLLHIRTDVRISVDLILQANGRVVRFGVRLVMGEYGIRPGSGISSTGRGDRFFLLAGNGYQSNYPDH